MLVVMSSAKLRYPDSGGEKTTYLTPMCGYAVLHPTKNLPQYLPPIRFNVFAIMSGD